MYLKFNIFNQFYKRCDLRLYISKIWAAHFSAWAAYFGWIPLQNMTWFIVCLQAMREAMVSLAREKQQSQEPIAAAERVRRMSTRVEELRRASTRLLRSAAATSTDTDDEEELPASEHQLPVSALSVGRRQEGRGAERRRSVMDLIGNIDEGFTALTWSVSLCIA